MTVFLNALPGAVSQGLIWGIMAIGVYLTYKILDIADLTVDGSFCTGGAVFVMLFTQGVGVWPAMLAALLAGMLAGLVSGLLNAACGIPAILCGILTSWGSTPSIWPSWIQGVGGHQCHPGGHPGETAGLSAVCPRGH